MYVFEYFIILKLKLSDHSSLVFRTEKLKFSMQKSREFLNFLFECFFNGIVKVIGINRDQVILIKGKINFNRSTW